MNATFEVLLQVTPGGLDLQWRVDNDEPHAIGLFNWIPAVAPDGTYRFSCNAAWVEIAGDGLLVVSKSALPIPPRLGMAAYVPPLCTRVASGASYEETVHLQIPVLEMQPFKRATLIGPTPGEVVADLPASVSKVSFGIGVFPIIEGLQLVSDHPAFPEVLTAWPGAASKQVVFAREFTLAKPLDVHGYRVAPWP